MPVSDTTITSWSTTVDDNAPARSDEIGGLLGEQVRNIRSVVRAESENKQWIKLSLAPTYVSATQFSVPGDQRADFAVGRRVKATLSGSTKYGTIMSRNFASAVTTVTMDWDLEDYPGLFFTLSETSLEINDTNATTIFVAGLRCEFSIGAGGNTRVPARVASSSYDGFDTTVEFETGGGSLIDLDAEGVDFLRIQSAGIDNTLSAVELGAFTPALLQSGWPATVMAGQFEIAADNTAGPFLIEMPWRQPDSDYVPLVQPTGSSGSAPSGVQWLLPFVSSRNTTHFGVQFTAAMTTGTTFTYDFVILRGQP